MPSKELEDSRIVSVRLPITLVQRLDRVLDWQTTIDAVLPRAAQPCATPCAAGSTSKSSWQDSWTRRSSGNSSRPPTTACVRLPMESPILGSAACCKPRERFDAVLEALRAAQAVDLEALTEPTGDAQATHDSYQVHGQCYGRLRWRA